MRNYTHVDRYLDDLIRDIYAQPPDSGHQHRTETIIKKWIAPLPKVNSILDVGCGQGNALEALGQYAGRVEGVTLGEDYQVCAAQNMPVVEADMSFLPYEAGEFDLIFARHVLEHSPAPLLTLMEWRRVSNKWLLAVMPSPSSFAFYGLNHYYVLLPEQWETLINRAGWNVTWFEEDGFEHSFFCERSDLQ